MRIISIIGSEMKHRPVSSVVLVAVPLVMVAISGILSAFLSAHSHAEAAVLDSRAKALRDQMRFMWNEYRLMTRDLGFNVLILPEGQNLADFYTDNFSSRYMPESYADSLARSPQVLVQHILPALVQRDYWPEKKRSVFVYGVRGEAARPGNEVKSPIQQPVGEGSIVCGYEVCRSEGFTTGDTVSFHGVRLRVGQCHERRGNRDDASVWIGLERAQTLYGKPGLINAILALECRCEADSALPNLAKIRKSLAGLLPQTQVIEFMSETITRAEARYAALEAEQSTLENDKKAVAAATLRRQRFTATVTAAIAAGSSVLMLILSFLNIRARMPELGTLRAVGIGGSRLFLIFGGKLLILGLAGSALGLAAVVIANTVVAAGPLSGNTPAIVAAGILCTVTPGLVPVIFGLTRQPAAILKGIA